ncbi:hypothetical protein DVH05_002012 [Phytophthora capsici]|nr:hypothetical protein DVH05_002012 [Phytophthora capsici]
MEKLAQRDYGIKSEDWHSGANRGFKWGVHDDIILQVLGDLLVNKTKEKTQRVAKGEQKTSLFTTHYTISSHAPFKARPTWYAKAEKPDFSAFYKGQKQAGMIKNYLEMRYFAD